MRHLRQFLSQKIPWENLHVSISEGCKLGGNIEEHIKQILYEYFYKSNCSKNLFSLTIPMIT